MNKQIVATQIAGNIRLIQREVEKIVQDESHTLPEKYQIEDLQHVRKTLTSLADFLNAELYEQANACPTCGERERLIHKDGRLYCKECATTFIEY